MGRKTAEETGKVKVRNKHTGKEFWITYDTYKNNRKKYKLLDDSKYRQKKEKLYELKNEYNFIFDIHKVVYKDTFIDITKIISTAFQIDVFITYIYYFDKLYNIKHNRLNYLVNNFFNKNNSEYDIYKNSLYHSIEWIINNFNELTYDLDKLFGGNKKLTNRYFNNIQFERLKTINIDNIYQKLFHDEMDIYLTTFLLYQKPPDFCLSICNKNNKLKISELNIIFDFLKEYDFLDFHLTAEGKYGKGDFINKILQINCLLFIYYVSVYSNLNDSKNLIKVPENIGVLLNTIWSSVFISTRNCYRNNQNEALYNLPYIHTAITNELKTRFAELEGLKQVKIPLCLTCNEKCVQSENKWYCPKCKISYFRKALNKCATEWLPSAKEERLNNRKDIDRTLETYTQGNLDMGLDVEMKIDIKRMMEKGFSWEEIKEELEL